LGTKEGSRSRKLKDAKSSKGEGYGRIRGEEEPGEQNRGSANLQEKENA